MKFPVAESTTSPNGGVLTLEPGLIARFPTLETTTLAGQFASQAPPETAAGEVTSRGVVEAVEVKYETGPTVSVGAAFLKTNSPPAVPPTVATAFVAVFKFTSAFAIASRAGPTMGLVWVMVPKPSP